jgi:hypothetical protein
VGDIFCCVTLMHSSLRSVHWADQAGFLTRGASLAAAPGKGLLQPVLLLLVTQTEGTAGGPGSPRNPTFPLLHMHALCRDAHLASSSLHVSLSSRRPHQAVRLQHLHSKQAAAIPQLPVLGGELALQHAGLCMRVVVGQAHGVFGSALGTWCQFPHRARAALSWRE